jgi:hypothetical protein
VSTQSPTDKVFVKYSGENNKIDSVDIVGSKDIVIKEVSLCTSCHGKTNFNRENWQLFFEKHLQNGRKIQYDILT